MASPRIIPKKSVISKVPAPSDLVSGEVAINYADAVWYGKHPSSGSVITIGAPYLHSHDQLISIDQTAELELQNNGSIIVADAAVTTTLAFSSSTGRTLTFPDKDGTIALLSDVAEDISADSITFDTTATETEAVAKMFWNTTEGGLQVGLAGGNVQLQIGSMLVAYVRNDEATTLNKGEVVYLYGASGNRASVRRASNAGDATSSKTIGVVAESIAPNQIGFVVTQGVLDGLALGSPYLEGDSIYLGNTAGTFTRVKPTQPNHIVFIGVVERANAGNGQLYIKPQNGFELEELHDVLISSPQNNQTILYNSAVTLWQNATITTGTISGLTAELAKKVEKESTDSTPINVLRALTQAEYDSIVTKDPFTIYFIKQ
jgi:hypothetical protein